MSETTRTPKVRMTAFRWGAVVGLAFTVAAGVGIYVWIQPVLYALPFDVEVLSHGAEVTRGGGARVVVHDEQGVRLEQVCRDECDDVQFQADMPDNAVGITVYDVAGRVLTSVQPEVYVTNGTLTRFVVTSGGDGLKVRISYIDEARNGSVSEMRLDDPPAASRSNKP